MPKGIYIRIIGKNSGKNKGKHWKQRCKRKVKAFTEEHRKKISERMKGSYTHLWKDGRSYDKEYISWLKNKRNRSPKIGFHTWGEWELLKKQYNYTCPCCKDIEPKVQLSQDHIIPLSKGGSDYIENIQPLCKSCNFKKHTKIIKY